MNDGKVLLTAKEVAALPNPELKKRLKDLAVDEGKVDMRSNPAIRRALWDGAKNLQPAPTLVPLEKEDGKRIWEALQKQLPLFAFFRADRPSRDEDEEVQDPMNVAVSETLKELEPELEAIKTAVRERTTELARRTLEKLREIDPKLANELVPTFRAEPKWDQLFKLSLTGDDQIPINKRGSGARRLILLSFFRAEAERKAQAANASGVVYAIEEPEASQHPVNQQLIVGALAELSRKENCQVIITTHVPGLAKLLPLESLRYVTRDADGTALVVPGGSEIYERIAKELGVLPAPAVPTPTVKVIVCVEGPNDVHFLKTVSRLLHPYDLSIPDLSPDPRVAVIPLGGSTLQQWVDKQYLKVFKLPEVHLYDRGGDTPPRYQEQVDEINRRNDGSYAVLTGKREIENYLHSDDVREVYGFRVVWGDNDDVPELVAREVHLRSGSATPWDQLDEEEKRQKKSRAKQRLNNDVLSRMTLDRALRSDPGRDLEGFLRQIAARLD